MVQISKNYIFVLISTLLQLNLWIGWGTAFPISQVFTKTKAIIYLSKFGWLDPTYDDSNGSESLIKFRKSLQEFQTYEGLPATGEIDEETVEIMETPRCGVSDKFIVSSRYTLTGSKWEFKSLSYSISKFPRSLRTLGGRERIESEIQRAFSVWEAVSDFTFTRKTSGKVDIDIRFERGDHGEGSQNAFDGPGGTLAHATSPPSGIVHFDDDEQWTAESYKGTNFFQVAAHEFGHTLGLGHSNIRAALMYEGYVGYNPNFKLHSDDVQAIQALYGSTSNGRPSPPRETPTSGRRPSWETPTFMNPPWWTPSDRSDTRPSRPGGMTPRWGRPTFMGPSWIPAGRRNQATRFSFSSGSSLPHSSSFPSASSSSSFSDNTFRFPFQLAQSSFNFDHDDDDNLVVD